MRSMVLCLVSVFAFFFVAPAPAAATLDCGADNTVLAKVVALDQAWAWNRYGALQPHGMMFALRRDVCAIDEKGKINCPEDGKEIDLKAGQVILRPDKRPRPLVLRVNRNQCLKVEFTNLLDESHRNRFLADRPEHAKCGSGERGPFDNGEGCGEQPGERWAGFHPNGLELAQSEMDDASHVGDNESSLVPPNGSITYTFLARHEGTFFVYSPAATTGGDGNGGSIFAGLFGAVNVEPTGSVWYRSQVRQEELEKNSSTDTTYGHPIVDFSKFAILGPAREIWHSDLTAIVDTRESTFESDLAHDCFNSMEEVDQYGVGVCAKPTKPFREFTIIFHDESGAVQAFDEFDGLELEGCDDENDSEICRVARAKEDILHSVRDGFAINYGTAGAGAEILANRKKLGPVRDCPECMMEEFFLSSWAVGDPAMVVDLPANLQKANARPRGVYYPDDPSNVYHSYLNDRVIFRNLHAGPKEHHVFHLHAHQWLQTQYNPRSSYLDSQTIGPGGTYTYEIAYGGSGNRNRTVGDSIFHCHFYPHFAQGMWSLWRVHDVFEAGTRLLSGPWLESRLAVAADGARALPDGEIAAGSPIPALLPLPDYALAPMPGAVTITDGQVQMVEKDKNPGYPFFVPGLAGHRPPEPPLDSEHDGGLHRHVVAGGLTDADALVEGNQRSLHKEWVSLEPRYLAEDGEPREKLAMEFHEQAAHATVDSAGNPAFFYTNGRKRQPGAPFADPCPAGLEPGTGEEDSPPEQLRKFEAAAFQLDLVFNKKGWHTPQARMLALRDDVEPTMEGKRPPQPLFFRVNSGDCIEFHHSNLVPRFWEQDAFQIKSPTDVIGQHIHLVKFDVTSSDGSGNGFNYEDGTASPEEVRQRIKAIRQHNRCGWSWPWTKGSEECPKAEKHPWYGWKYAGGKVTIQRWYADPQWVPTQTPVNAPDQHRLDKTLETVFTHDHFGPSTHQQAGLYAGLIVEPKGSTYWERYEKKDDDFYLSGELSGRRDGGPTSWKAIVSSPDVDEYQDRISTREFGILYQDFLIAYEKGNDTGKAINAPGQVAADERRPKFLVQWEERCTTWPHCPEAVSADDIGVMSINYRSEPAPLRLLDGSRQLASGDEGDLAFLFRSIRRADGDLNRHQDAYPLVGGVSRSTWPLLTPGMKRYDPFTPMLEVFDDERFSIRLLAGAHEHEHSFTVNGISWRAMSHERDSGDRSFLTSALSEHHEVDGVLRIPASLAEDDDSQLPIDHLFKIGASVDDIWYGNWGLLRAYRRQNAPAHLVAIPDEDIELPEEMAAEEGVATFAPRLVDAAVTGPKSRRELIDDFKREQALKETGAADGFEALATARSANESARRRTEALRRMSALAPLAGEARALSARALAAGAAAPPTRLELALAEETADLEETVRLVEEALKQPDVHVRMAHLDDDGLEEFRLRAERTVRGLPSAGNFRETMTMMSVGRELLPQVIDIVPIEPLAPGDDARLVATDQGAIPVCPVGAPLRAYGISAVTAAAALEDGTLVYHRFSGEGPRCLLEDWRTVNDPTALIYVRDRYLENGKLLPGYKVEPLILRARAGDCIEIHLTNRLPQKPGDLAGYNTLPNIVSHFNFNQLPVSRHVGLHIHGLRYHPGESDGMNVGINPIQTIAPLQKKVYRFYAGRIEKDQDDLKYVPVELGVLNIQPADPIKQNSKGLIGALVIEPSGAVWAHDEVPAEPYSGTSLGLVSRASATVFRRLDDGSWGEPFRDLVLVGQNDANFQLAASRGHGEVYHRPVRRVAMAANCGIEGCLETDVRDEEVDAVDTGHKAFNYRSEAMWMRRGLPAATPLDLTLSLPARDILADSFVSDKDNQTPRFCVKPGAETRLRIAFPGGHGRNHIIQVHGHSFPEHPFLEDSTELGENAWTFRKGSQDGFGPGSSYNFLLSGGACGANAVAADYLIRDQYSWGFDNGLWAVLRVDGSCPE